MHILSLSGVRALGLIACLSFSASLAMAAQTNDPVIADAVNETKVADDAIDGPARIQGHISLVSEDGERLRDRREMAHAVVYFEPDAVPDFTPTEEVVVMTTQRREFVPRVLTVVTGTEVRFPNEDPILHNVFSTSAGNRFDLGVYGESPGKSHRFDTPGLVRIFCNVHSRMSAHIVVVNSPYFITPDSDGSFTLDDVPPGAGRLTFWHERAEPQRVHIELESGEQYTHKVELPLTVRQAAPQRERFRRRGRY